MRSSRLLLLGLLLLSAPALAAADAPTSPRPPPPIVGLAPTGGALLGGLLVGAPSAIFMLGSGIGFGGPAYHLLPLPALDKVEKLRVLHHTEGRVSA
jgi:hypothetical protein